MAEIVDNNVQYVEHKKYASNSKGNAALTLGIIGTALSGLTMLGGIGAAVGRNAGCGGWNNGGWNNNYDNGWNRNGVNLQPIVGMGGANHPVIVSEEELYLERLGTQRYIDMNRALFEEDKNLTKELCEEDKKQTRALTEAFFDSYKRDVDNSFMLYKYSRDNKDELNEKIDHIAKKVDVMAAVRPYQDALIDQKINTNALIADFNLARRTCKMIEGQLVLPSEPVVTGYGSFPTCNCGNRTA